MPKVANPPDQTLRWASTSLGPGSRIAHVRAMGSSSTAQHALDFLDRSGGKHRLVLRRYVDRDRLAEDPWYRPEAEVEALRVISEADVPALRLIAEDVAARHCDVPTLLVTRLPGRPLGNHPKDLARYLRDAAEVLHLVHAIDPHRAANLQAYAPYEPPSTLPIPTWSSRPGLWARVLEVLEGPAPADEARFIHRDYHPANIVLDHGRVAGVVDWPTACRGPRSIDLARMRLNLVANFGMEAADLFLHLYEERAETTWAHDPYWDLQDAVDSAQDADEPGTTEASAAWERFERWVEMALAGRRG